MFQNEFLEELNSIFQQAASIHTSKPDFVSPAFRAEQVIFHPPATIVYWADGNKTVVRCDNDEFSEEFGFAMACVRKLYGSRNNFKAQFKNAQRPHLTKTEKPEKKSFKPDKLQSTPAHHKTITLDELMKFVGGNDSIGVRIELKD